MSSSFPLLRLPGVVLCEVFKSLSIGEKIKLSFCSKKISNRINNARMYSQNVIVDLDMLNRKIRVRSENNRDTFQVSIHIDFWKSHSSNTEQFSIKFFNVRVMSMRLRIRTFYENHQEEFLSVIRHLLKMFQCKISTSDSCFASDLFQPTISMLFDLQLEFKTLCIRLDGVKYRNLLWNQISRYVGFVECLNISSSFDIDFTLVFTSWPQEIMIMRSAWFTLESLLACASFIITLYDSHLENKDMDEILKNWKTGGLPNLKRLAIDSLSFEDNGEQILGMNLSELDGMVLQTDDGIKMATIELGPHRIEMSVTLFE